MRTIAAGGYSVPASHHGANVSEKACAVLPPIAGFYERLSFVGGRTSSSRMRALLILSRDGWRQARDQHRQQSQ
jgi:hypothetical protein